MRNTNTQQARKQRKSRYNADLHEQQKFVHVHLSPELRKKYGFRNVQLRKGDKIKVCRGQFRKKETKVDRVDLKRETVFLEGVETIKKDGTKVPSPFKPSNLMIISLELGDKKRKAKLESKSKQGKESKTAEKKAVTKTEDKK